MSIHQLISNVKSMPLRKGKNELLIHLKGGRNLTLREAVLAKCYECEGGFEIKAPCRVLTCSLTPFHQFQDGGPRKSRIMSDEKRKAAADRMRRARAK